MYIGLDVGTSGVKAIIFSPEGKVLCQSSRTYPFCGTGEQLELSPDTVFDRTLEVLGEIAAEKREVQAMGLSSLGEACVFLDKDGNSVRNTILPGDPRGSEFIPKLFSAFPPGRIEEITGAPVNSTYTLLKLLWIKEHEPENYEKTAMVMLYGDYVAWRLSGNRGISHSLASRTLAFDCRNCVFSREILDTLGVNPGLFSSPVSADSFIGTLTPVVCTATGLPPGTKVYAGGHDQPCAAVGSRCLVSGQAADSMGSSECITPIIGKTLFDSAFITKTNFAAEPFLVVGMYNTMAYTHTSGRLLEWFVKSILKRSSYAELDNLCCRKPTGLLILPHFAGAATPTMDHRSVGAIVGLNLHTDEVRIYQGLMENINYEMKLNMDLLRENGVPLQEITASGGGAKSKVWLQIKADILGVPVRIPECKESSAMGAAMAAAKGTGAFSSYEEAALAMVKIKTVYEPDQARTVQFEEQYLRYGNLYTGIKHINQGGAEQ
jgi:xylulokinase